MAKKKKKTKRKAVRNPITGKVDHYTNTKSVGLRDPFDGKIKKRVSKKKAKKRGIAKRTYTVSDRVKDTKRKKKKKKSGWL
ncbi:MAG: hypothetical protein R6U26_00570 [Candidatus Undinarchaeales archaeon]